MWYGGHGYLNLGSRIPSALQAGNFITNNHFYVLFYVLFFPPHCPTIISALYSCSTPLSVCIFFFFPGIILQLMCVFTGIKAQQRVCFPCSRTLAKGSELSWLFQETSTRWDQLGLARPRGSDHLSLLEKMDHFTITSAVLWAKLHQLWFLAVCDDLGGSWSCLQGLDLVFLPSLKKLLILSRFYALEGWETFGVVSCLQGQS